MTTSDLPNAILKISIALAKHHIKNVIGDEALEVVATTMADVGGEKVRAKVDSIFASQEGKAELLKAAKAADERFRETCQDNDLRQLFAMDYGDLPSVQEAIAGLPEALDDEALRKTLFTAFRNDAPKSLNDEKINEGVGLYVECLQSALLPVEEFGLRIIHNALKEIGRDVKDIKTDVRVLLEKAGGAADAKSPRARFLVPFPHNPDFVGREVELTTLHELLQPGGAIVGIRPMVLVGLGGIGKTQLAVEYAHAHRNDYPGGIFWLNAINPLLDEFCMLAETLEMADKDTPLERAARAAWDYLDSHPDALVIFDNILEPSELNLPILPGLIPANLRCHTLFTTRQRDFPRTFQPFEVKVLPEMAAMHLLLRSRREVLEEHHPEWGWARIVCASLGWLPLALELAAAYLSAYPEVSITGYLERLRTEGSLETVDESEVRAVDLPTRVEEILKAAARGNLEIKHQVAVSATLQTQWNRLDHEDARLLFRAAGQFPEASWIPIARLGLLTGIESEASLGRPSPLNVALKKLHTVSLIEELTDDRLRLHPLVQEFAAQLSPASFRSELAKQVAIALYDFSRLQSHVGRYGVYAVLEDVRTGLRFIADSVRDDTYLQLSDLDRALDRLAHHVLGWNIELRPSFLLQELYNAATLLNLDEIRLNAKRTLDEKNFQYLVHKSTSHEESQELRRTLAGHTAEVRSVAISADGKLAISGAEDNTLIVWDVEQGTKLHTLQCVGYDLESSLWVGDSGQGVEISGDWARVDLNNNDVAISPDGRVALSVSSYRATERAPENANAIVWDVKSGRELRRFSCSRAVLIADGKFAYAELDPEETKSAAWEKRDTQPPRTQVLDITTGLEVSDPLYMSEKYFKTINNIQSASGKLTISSQERKAKLQWVDKTGTLYRVAMSADGRLAASAMPDNILKVWDVISRQEVGTFVGHLAKINDVAMSANGRIVISASSDKTLKVWDIPIQADKSSRRSNAKKTITSQAQSQSHNSTVNSVAISADGSLAISASTDTIKVWDVVEATQLNELSATYRVNDVALSSGKKFAILATRDKNMKVLNVKDLQELRTLQGHGNWVTGVSISGDERTVISASSDKTLRTWKLLASRDGDFITCSELHTLRGHTKDVVDVSLSADGRLALSASMDHTLKVWDSAKGKELRTIVGASELRNVALSADGKTAISTAIRDARIRVWNVATGQEIHALRGHKYGVSAITLSADGSLAASIEDKILNVWSVRKQQIVATFRSNVSLNCCAMSADGRRILVGDVQGGIHFLQLMGTGGS